MYDMLQLYAMKYTDKKKTIVRKLKSLKNRLLFTFFNCYIYFIVQNYFKQSFYAKFDARIFFNFCYISVNKSIQEGQL